MFKDSFLKDNVLMFIGVSFSSTLSLVYQLYVVRRLSPQEFGLFSTLLAILSIVSISLGAFQTVTADFVARLFVDKQILAIKLFLFRIIKIISIISLLFFISFLIFSSRIAGFLLTDSLSSIVIIGFTITLYFLLPVFHGALQGLQKFQPLSRNIIIQSFSRLIIGVLMIIVGFKVMGALSAFAISTLIALFLAFFTLRDFLSFRNEKMDLVLFNQFKHVSIQIIVKHFIPTSLGLFGFMLLTNVDMVLVKHFFSPENAGHYSIAQMVGRMVLFFSAPVSLVMFPKIASCHSQNHETKHVLNKSIIITAILSMFIILIVLFFPELILRIIAGVASVESLKLVKLYSIVMGFHALNGIFLYYNLSVRNFKAVYVLAGFALAQVILISIFHASLIEVVQVLCLVSVSLFGVNILLLNKYNKWNIHLSV